jgi:hypothetical protein
LIAVASDGDSYFFADFLNIAGVMKNKLFFVILW